MRRWWVVSPTSVRLYRGCERRIWTPLCWQNDFCLEDTLFAGALLERLAPVATPCGDAATMALTLWRQAQDDPLAYCQQATHVHRLYGFGAEADVRFAFRVDTCPVVPMLKNDTLRLVTER